ncbi:hypothetical protein ID866_10652 [Astraeus odoratus]|nr:hypothetical protein ID866_10652 [Astraeus odoratus]
MGQGGQRGGMQVEGG